MTKHWAARRQAYNFGTKEDKPKAKPLSPLQHAVLDGRKSIREAKEDFIINIILYAMKHHGHNLSAVSRMLHVNRPTLIYYLDVLFTRQVARLTE
jgi:DNA-binding NtrC family response regulator